VRARALFVILFNILKPDSKTKNEARDQLSLILILKNVMRHSGDIMMKNKRKTLIIVRANDLFAADGLFGDDAPCSY
jgi:hypothetical protein